MDKLLQITNGECIERGRIPRMSPEIFYRQLNQFVRNGGFIVQFFAYPENKQMIQLAVLRSSNLYILETAVTREYPSLTRSAGAKFNLFERSNVRLRNCMETMGKKIA